MAKFLGLNYPMIKGPQGYFAQCTDVDTIKADMLQLLLTNPGERVFLPQFGTPLRNLIFEQATAATIAAAKAMIQNSLKVWEPRVAIQQVNIQVGGPEVSSDPGGDQVLVIQILFIDPQQIQTVQQLDLQVPLSGGVVNTEPALGSIIQSQPTNLNTNSTTGTLV